MPPAGATQGAFPGPDRLSPHGCPRSRRARPPGPRRVRRASSQRPRQPAARRDAPFPRLRDSERLAPAGRGPDPGETRSVAREEPAGRRPPPRGWRPRSPPERAPCTPATLPWPSSCPRAPRSRPGLGWRAPGAPPSAAPRASTLAAGAALQDDERRLAQPLGAAARGAQLAQVGVRFGVAAAHRLAAGAHADAGLRAPPHRGGGGHPEGDHALQPLAARALLQAALGALGRAAHLAAAARVADAAALAGLRRRGAAPRLAALGAPGGRQRRAAGAGRLRRDARPEQQQQQQLREERVARGLHGDSDGGGLRREPGRLRAAGASARGRAAQPIGLAAVTSRFRAGRGAREGAGPARRGSAGRGAGPAPRGMRFPPSGPTHPRGLSPRLATSKLKGHSAEGSLRCWPCARGRRKVPASCRAGDPPRQWGEGRRCPDHGRQGRRWPQSRARGEEGEHLSVLTLTCVSGTRGRGRGPRATVQRGGARETGGKTAPRPGVERAKSKSHQNIVICV